jgi:hypothetical protein
MMGYLLTALSGWTSAGLLVLGTLTPYIVRSLRPHPSSYLSRLRPHYWFGFLALAFVVFHMWTGMSSSALRGTSATGIWLATLALFCLAVQLVFGLNLRSSLITNRRATRHLHFWIMVAVNSMTLTHIALNRF